jgi:alkaline phosphatase isozyme conversion protein
VTALRTRGAWLAIAVAAALVVAVGVAAAGAFGGCHETADKAGRPSAAVTATAYGSVGYVTAKTLAVTVPRRVADTWGEIRARESVYQTFQQYGYFPRLQEFIARGTHGRVHSANIIAVKEGDSAKQLIVGAHYDSAAVGQGYADNATGIGLLLETAARIKRQVTPYTIVFVAFGAEEQGQVGSRYYVSQMKPVERKATLGMIDLDAPAGGAELNVTSAPGGPAWLRDDVLTAAQSQGLQLGSGPANDGLPAGVARTPGDHDPFAAAGIATASFTSGPWTDEDGGAGARLAARDTVPYIDGRYPGRVKQQLRQLSQLLETLLTSKLETHR